MRLIDRRSRLERVLDSAPRDLPRELSSRLPSSKATKAGLAAAGGLAALTAASARISSRRRRSD